MDFKIVGDADQRLVANVHPGDWVQPRPRDRYDLVVVGGGTGGLVSAAIGGSLGARVALVERSLLGGDCLNHGCVPSKAIIRAARSWAEAREASRSFGGPEVGAEGDFSFVMDRMRRLRAELSEVDSAERFRSLGVDVFLGEAQFEGTDSLRVDPVRPPVDSDEPPVDSDEPPVDSVRLRFRRAILATGARPTVPAIPGLSEVRFLTSETVFGLTELPTRLLVLGAGPIGCELAQAFNRLGSRVTILDQAGRLLQREEPEASTVLEGAFQREGITFLPGASVVEVREEGGALTVGYEDGTEEEELRGDALLVAAGRTPNVDLNLEAAGVAHSPTGIQVDKRLRTTNRRIYAVGDVASPYQFTHVADAHARVAVQNALFFGRKKASDLVVPASTYTSPEVARVGPTLRELEDRGVAAETVTVPFSDLDRPRLDGEPEGFAQVLVRKGKAEILGATIVAGNAGDLIAQITQAMTLGLGLDELGDVIFPYPTTAEAWKKAADLHRRQRLTPRVRRLFDIFFKVVRRFP